MGMEGRAVTDRRTKIFLAFKVPNRPFFIQTEEDESLKAMYEDMYSSHDEPRRGSSSRRFSFPNSPLGGGDSGGPSLTKHLQQLCLQNRLVQGSGGGDVSNQAGDTKIKVKKPLFFGCY